MLSMMFGASPQTSSQLNEKLYIFSSFVTNNMRTIYDITYIFQFRIIPIFSLFHMPEKTEKLKEILPRLTRKELF